MTVGELRAVIDLASSHAQVKVRLWSDEVDEDWDGNIDSASLEVKGDTETLWLEVEEPCDDDEDA
jgi:hypothetical protein